MSPIKEELCLEGVGLVLLDLADNIIQNNEHIEMS
jgi:hypothetical protein